MKRIEHELAVELWRAASVVIDHWHRDTITESDEFIQAMAQLQTTHAAAQDIVYHLKESEMKYCPNCGHNIAARQQQLTAKLVVNFCPECGVDVRPFRAYSIESLADRQNDHGARIGGDIFDRPNFR